MTQSHMCSPFHTWMHFPVLMFRLTFLSTFEPWFISKRLNRYISRLQTYSDCACPSLSTAQVEQTWNARQAVFSNRIAVNKNSRLILLKADTATYVTQSKITIQLNYIFYTNIIPILIFYTNIFYTNCRITIITNIWRSRTFFPQSLIPFHFLFLVFFLPLNLDYFAKAKRYSQRLKASSRFTNLGRTKN